MKLRPSGLPFRIPGWAWLRLKTPGRRPQAGPHKLPDWFWVWRIWRLGLGPKPTTLYMYDDVNVSLIPSNAEAVAGYVGGRWPTFPEVVKKFPKAKHLSIAVTSLENARVLDVEPGDAEPSQAPGWVKKQHARGVKLPILYTSASQGQKLIDLCSSVGLVYGKDYLWWSAHYNYKPHFCSPKCGFGIKVTAHATQFTDRALGRSLDESICRAPFFE